MFWKRTKRLSLRTKLLSVLLPGILVILCAELWLARLDAIEAADAAFDRSLHGAIRSLDLNVSTASGGLAVELPYRLFEFFQLTAGGNVYFRVASGDGLVEIGSPDLPQPDVPMEPGVLAFEDAIYFGEPVRVGTYVRELERPLGAAGGRRLVIQVAEGTATRRAFTQKFVLRSALRDAALISMVGLTLAVLVSVALRPVSRLAEAVTRRKASDLRPLSDAGLPSDIQPLVDAVNQQLARTSGLMERQRIFVDDASHQLRTSLATLHAQVGYAQRQPAPQFVIHSSLSFEERRRAEEAFVQGTDCVIIATSALELGIDIGDLDHVFQIDAPRSVAAFLQRMGRTGRRRGTERNCTFLATEEDSLIQAAAIIRLFQAGFVEPIHPIRRAPHILAHQLLALAIQESGVPESDWWGWISPASAFSELTAADRDELLTHMLGEGILMRDRGRLALGPRGEQLYGWRNFLELYSVFTTSDEMTVLWGAQELGKLETNFVTQQDLGQLTFILGARTWRALSVDLEHGVVHVEPVADARDAQWQGQPALMHRELCEAIREVLTSRDEDSGWSTRARTCIAGARAESEFLPRDRSLLIEDADGFTFWTFAGGRANNLLAKVMESIVGERVTAGNFAIKFRDEAAKGGARIADAFRLLHEQGRPSDEDALRFAASCARARLSKFQPCLSDPLEATYLAALLTDPTGARQVVKACG